MHFDHNYCDQSAEAFSLAARFQLTHQYILLTRFEKLMQAGMSLWLVLCRAVFT
jgi:hypothetical protein